MGAARIRERSFGLRPQDDYLFYFFIFPARGGSAFGGKLNKPIAMPIKESAKKELRKAKKRRVLNVRRQKTMKDALKNIKKLILAGKKDDAKKLLSAAYQAIDKAAKRGVIKKNAAARKKSRLMKSLNK